MIRLRRKAAAGALYSLAPEHNHVTFAKGRKGDPQKPQPQPTHADLLSAQGMSAKNHFSSTITGIAEIIAISTKNYRYNLKR